VEDFLVTPKKKFVPV